MDAVTLALAAFIGILAPPVLLGLIELMIPDADAMTMQGLPSGGRYG